MVKGLARYVANLNVYVTDHSTEKYIMQKPTELKGEIKNSSYIWRFQNPYISN